MSNLIFQTRVLERNLHTADGMRQILEMMELGLPVRALFVFCQEALRKRMLQLNMKPERRKEQQKLRLMERNEPS